MRRMGRKRGIWRKKWKRMEEDENKLEENEEKCSRDKCGGMRLKEIVE